MRVGILTFHEIHNPGAFLQTLGTVTLLRELGYDPVVLDYTSATHRFSPLRIVTNWRLWIRPRSIIELFGRRAAFMKEQRYLPLSRKYLTHLDLQREAFDAILIGADIVWDYQASFLERDPVFFGKHLNAAKKIAFAASCGSAPAEQELPDYVKEGIRQMYAIGVRDENTRLLVERQGRNAELICDPAFHLDDNRWSAPPVSQKPYLLVYGPTRHFAAEDVDQIKAYAREKQLKIKAVCYRQEWVDENDVCIGPFQWLGLIRAAQAVVTSTFHGTVFSLKAGKPLAIIDNPHATVKLSAMHAALELDRVLLRPPRSLSDILNRPLDTERTQAVIQQWRKHARRFIVTALEGAS